MRPPRGARAPARAGRRVARERPPLQERRAPASPGDGPRRRDRPRWPRRPRGETPAATGPPPSERRPPRPPPPRRRAPRRPRLRRRVPRPRRATASRRDGRDLRERLERARPERDVSLRRGPRGQRVPRGNPVLRRRRQRDEGVARRRVAPRLAGVRKERRSRRPPRGRARPRVAPRRASRADRCARRRIAPSPPRPRRSRRRARVRGRTRRRPGRRPAGDRSARRPRESRSRAPARRGCAARSYQSSASRPSARGFGDGAPTGTPRRPRARWRAPRRRGRRTRARPGAPPPQDAASNRPPAARSRLIAARIVALARLARRGRARRHDLERMRALPPSMPSPDPTSSSDLGRLVRRVPLGLAQALGDLDDAPLDAPEDARRREAPAASRSPAGTPGQDLDPLRDRVDGVEVELPAVDRLGHVVAQDEVRQVRAAG